MRVGIFYFSLDSGAERHSISNAEHQHVGFVRVDEVEANDLLDALDRASPEANESVMNTHALEPTDKDECPRCGSPNWAYEGDRQVCADCRLGSGSRSSD